MKNKKSSWHTLHSSKLWLVLILGLIALGAWEIITKDSTRKATPPVQKQPPASAQPVVTRIYSKEEILDLLNRLLADCAPGNPKNSYMPEDLKLRLDWVYRAYFDKKILKFGWATTRVEKIGAWLGALYHLDGTPGIAVSASEFSEIINREREDILQPSRKLKNSFATALAHEVEHLFLGKERVWALKDNPVGQQAEEMRVWSLISQKIVAPLRQIGEPIFAHFAAADDAARSCGYHPNCQALRDYLAKHERK